MEQRYIFTLLAFLGNMANMFGRDSLRIGVLAIRQEFETCMAANSSECGAILWDDGSVAQVLSGFNYGMLLTLLIGGPLADILGGKVIMLAATLVSSTCTALIPLLASTSLLALVTSQVVYGMSGGLVVPSLASMLARWEPLGERGRLATVIYSGSQASAALTAVFTGLLCHEKSHHWRLVFLLLGLLPLLWLFPWGLLVTDSPRSHPRISQREKKLLHCNTATSEARPLLKDIPLKAILSSGTVVTGQCLQCTVCTVKCVYCVN